MYDRAVRGLEEWRMHEGSRDTGIVVDARDAVATIVSRTLTPVSRHYSVDYGHCLTLNIASSCIVLRTCCLSVFVCMTRRGCTWGCVGW